MEAADRARRRQGGADTGLMLGDSKEIWLGGVAWLAGEAWLELAEKKCGLIGRFCLSDVCVLLFWCDVLGREIFVVESSFP